MDEKLVIRVYPDYGHPSSLWASEELILQAGNGFTLLPWQLGIEKALDNRIIEWTEQFHTFYIEGYDGFEHRPHWRDGIDPEAWHREGMGIVTELERFFPDAEILARFDGYVFSVNELRVAKGLLPLTMPGVHLPGHLSYPELKNRPDQHF